MIIDFCTMTKPEAPAQQSAQVVGGQVAGAVFADPGNMAEHNRNCPYCNHMIKKDKKQTPAMVLLFTPNSKHALWTAPGQHASPGEGPVPRPVLPRQPVHLGGGGHLAPAPAARPRHHEGVPTPGTVLYCTVLHCTVP